MDDTTPAPGQPQMPWHPEPRSHSWSALEIRAIMAYGRKCFEAGRALTAAPQAPAAQAGEALADDVLEALDLSPETFRTEGGVINKGKLRAAILHPSKYLPPEHWLQAPFGHPPATPTTEAPRSGVPEYEAMRIELIVQIHNLLDLGERYAGRIYKYDPDEARYAEGAVAHARKVSAPFNYNGTTPPAAAPAAPAPQPAEWNPQFDALGIAELWDVSVHVAGEPVLTIGNAGYSGLPDIERFEPTIESAARHLLGFIGSAAPAPQPVMFNGLTEAETSATASVAGLTQPTPTRSQKLAAAGFTARERFTGAGGLVRDKFLDESDLGLMSSLRDILDGRDTGEGVCPEPWESLRRRVLALVNPEDPQPIVTNPKAPGGLRLGDYVFASRWSDCDPGDPWAVGQVAGVEITGSAVYPGYVVVAGSGRRWPHAMRITHEQGERIVASYPEMEHLPQDYEAIAKVFAGGEPKPPLGGPLIPESDIPPEGNRNSDEQGSAT